MNETATARHWLHEFASTDESRRAHSPWLLAPFSIVVDGERWSGACDGKVAVLIREASEFPAIPDGRDVVLLGPALRGGERHEIDLAAFRAWAHIPEPEPKLPCEECDGEGEVDCEDCAGGVCSCSRCGEEHDCGTCDGTGSVPCSRCAPGAKWPSQPGVLYGAVTVDRRYFAPLFRLDADRGALSVLGPKDPIVLSGYGWHLIVMPLFMDKSADMPSWPRP